MVGGKVILARFPLHADGPRYTCSLLFLPDLWAPARLWLPVASFLGHRGWEGELLDLRRMGGLAGRTAAVIEHARSVTPTPVLIGHGAGALVALRAASVAGAAAVVLVCPLLPRNPGVRRLIGRWDAIAAIVRGRDIPPPCGTSARDAFGEVPTALEPDSARAVLDIAQGRPLVQPPLSMPTLVVAGACDPLLPSSDAGALAAMLRADRVEVQGAGHWPILPPTWQQTAGVIHRWLIRQLGEPLLDYYAEAMADREDGE